MDKSEVHKSEKTKVGTVYNFNSEKLKLLASSEKAERPHSNNYYILSDVSHFILSHTNLIHLGATSPKQILENKY